MIRYHSAALFAYLSAAMYSALRSVFVRACGDLAHKKLKLLIPERCDACIDPERGYNQMGHDICIMMTFAQQIQLFLPEVSRMNLTGNRLLFRFSTRYRDRSY